MKPQTSFETHQRAIQRAESDAKAFLSDAINSPADAQRIRAELALLTFDGVTGREWMQLDQERQAASGRISKAIEGVQA